MKYWALANQVCEIMNANAPLNTSRDESRDVQAVGKKNFRANIVLYTLMGFIVIMYLVSTILMSRDYDFKEKELIEIIAFFLFLPSAILLYFFIVAIRKL
jgi:predicted membrane channel-forming protein YqfA (hemolysin III family)